MGGWFLSLLDGIRSGAKNVVVFVDVVGIGVGIFDEFDDGDRLRDEIVDGGPKLE